MRDPSLAAGRVPTDKQVQALIADVVAILKRIEGFTVTLTTAQRRSTTKMRTGGDKVISTLAQLAQQHEIVLPQVSSAEMVANQAMAQRLEPLAAVTRQLALRVDDTITNANSESWWAATAMYTALSRVAAATPDLQAAMAPLVSFFAKNKRKKAPAAPATPTLETPPTPPVASGPSKPPTDQAA